MELRQLEYFVHVAELGSFTRAASFLSVVQPVLSRQVRALAYEELVIRYGIDVPFEPEMRVAEQKRQINTIARLCRANLPSFQPGEWYFARKLA